MSEHSSDDMSHRSHASYWLETWDDPQRAAEVIAGEKSSGTFLALGNETPALKARAGARVERLQVLDSVAQPSLQGLYPAGSRFTRCLLELSWPLANLGPSLPNLMAQVAGGAQHLLRSQPDMLAHLKEARVFLETGLARLAAERATADDVARLRRRLDEHRAAMVELDQFLLRDMAFHREIALISGNPIFPAIVEALFHWASEYYQTIVRAPDVESLTLAEHQRIVEAIAAHDADGAALAMREHLTRANALYGRAAVPEARAAADA